MNDLWSTHKTTFLDTIKYADDIGMNLTKWVDDMFNRKPFQSTFGAASTANSYPPCNIKAVSPGVAVLELAVAGFKRDDLSIKRKGNVLTISGEMTKDVDSDENVKYYHKGISSKKFVRTYTLDANTELMDATLSEGMLTITFNFKEPVESDGEIIEIK